MFYFMSSIKNIKRNKVKSTVCFLVISAIAMLFSVFINNIHRIGVQLEELAQAMLLQCDVTNLNGSPQNGLQIREFKDTDNEKKILKILHMLAYDKQYLVIIITHNQEIAQKADVHYQMQDGKLKKFC